MELTPLLGVLAGFVATLVVIALCVVCVLKRRNGDCDDKEKSDLKKVTGSVESLEKDPDIIPHNNGTFTCYIVNARIIYCSAQALFVNIVTIQILITDVKTVY